MLITSSVCDIQNFNFEAIGMLDITDMKEAIMETIKGVWNGDVDLGDGKLQELREIYDGRVSLVSCLAEEDGR